MPRLTLHDILSSVKHLFSTSYIIASLICLATIIQPDTTYIAFLVGNIINAIIAKILKKFLNQKRPLRHSHHSHHHHHHLHHHAQLQKNQQNSESELINNLINFPSSSTSSSFSPLQQQTTSISSSPPPSSSVSSVFGTDNNISNDVLIDEVHTLLGAGMPSSHAMALFFISTFLSLSIYYREKNSYSTFSSSIDATPTPILTRTFLHLLSYSSFLTDNLFRILYFFAATLSMHRVHISLHSFEQVLAGAALGSLDGLIYYFGVLPIILHFFGDQVLIGKGDGSVKSLLLSISILSIFIVAIAIILDRHVYRKVEKKILSIWEKFSSSLSSSTADTPTK